jgi:hypothetical protein
MNNHSFFDIVQVVTGLAVVAGLVLIIFELRQTHNIAAAQQATEYRASYDSVTIAEMGELLPIALARACEDPEHLTGPELVALNGYYLQLFFSALSAYSDEGAEISSRRSWRIYARGSFDAILASTPGQAWWEKQRESDWIPEDFLDFGNEHPRSTTCFLEGWRAAISENAD